MLRSFHNKGRKNVIDIRVFDRRCVGGFGGKRQDMYIKLKEEKKLSFYHADYLDNFKIGDDPYRYYRW
jgi:hypothetical protein